MIVAHTFESRNIKKLNITNIRNYFSGVYVQETNGEKSIYDAIPCELIPNIDTVFSKLNTTGFYCQNMTYDKQITL